MDGGDVVNATEFGEEGKCYGYFTTKLLLKIV